MVSTCISILKARALTDRSVGLSGKKRFRTTSLLVRRNGMITWHLDMIERSTKAPRSRNLSLDLALKAERHSVVVAGLARIRRGSLRREAESNHLPLLSNIG